MDALVERYFYHIKAIFQLCSKENTTPVINMASVSVVENPPVNPLSPLLSKKFNINDIKEDPLKWNEDLDDFFFTSDDLMVLHSNPRKFQEDEAQKLRIVSEHNFNVVWLLLNASEQRRHILEGLKKAYP